MNNYKVSYWLRFIFHAILFSIVFLVIVFLFSKDLFDNFKMLIIKTGGIAIVSSLLFTYLLELDAEVAD